MTVNPLGEDAKKFQILLLLATILAPSLQQADGHQTYKFYLRKAPPWVRFFPPSQQPWCHSPGPLPQLFLPSSPSSWLCSSFSDVNQFNPHLIPLSLKPSVAPYCLRMKSRLLIGPCRLVPPPWLSLLVFFSRNTLNLFQFHLDSLPLGLCLCCSLLLEHFSLITLHTHTRTHCTLVPAHLYSS